MIESLEKTSPEAVMELKKDSGFYEIYTQRTRVENLREQMERIDEVIRIMLDEKEMKQCMTGDTIALKEQLKRGDISGTDVERALHELDVRNTYKDVVSEVFIDEYNKHIDEEVLDVVADIFFEKRRIKSENLSLIRDVISDHFREIIGLEVDQKPSERDILDAVSYVNFDDMIPQVKEFLLTIAEKSPYESVQKALSEKLGLLDFE